MHGYKLRLNSYLMDQLEWCKYDEVYGPAAVKESRERGRDAEKEVADVLNRKGVDYVPEVELRNQGIPTPDFVLKSPLFSRDSSVAFKWIEVKASFGDDTEVKAALPQIRKYIKIGGPGILVFKHGYCDSALDVLRFDEVAQGNCVLAVIESLSRLPTSFYCKPCNHQFSTEQSYRNHCKSHEGCVYCGFSAIKSVLKKHVDQEHPWSCSSCVRSFRGWGNLRKHLDSHVPCYNCDFEACISVMRDHEDACHAYVY
eukprot:Colp12_sorted_trinity150504_noHs@7019